MGHNAPVDAKKSLWAKLGAGLITGAADDDPSGIATYSQVGAAYGYATVWSLFLAMPLMIAIQTISARIGCATGRGIGSNMRLYYPRGVVYGLILSVVVANVINLAADIGAMGAALKLLIGGPAVLYATSFALASLALQVWVPFSRYSPILKLLTLSLFAYIATVFVIHVPWGDVLKDIVLPKAKFDAKYAVAIVAVLGTTISPYLFFWQAAQEVEEIRASSDRKALKRAPSQGLEAIRRIGIDTTIGMLFSNIVACFIILTAAVVLHAHGKTDIQSSSDAAQALRPIAGPFAFYLFAAGIVGTGLLAVPILAGSTAFAVAGAFDEPYGLEQKPSQAKLFYGVLMFASVAGIALNFTPIDPIKALYWSAVINGVAAVPSMVMIMKMSTNSKVMGAFTISTSLNVWGWLATAVMAAAAVVMFVTWGK
ncbi:NRAMP (natural resistance-associated macrophage protein)-like metal ion transporter [Rhodanobacter sp. ANJX3]|uniref:NRAMP family divalent metal transporter n=1 Tax=unclassified Rhodanobacter TaxID=2621553 RepID=UPI0017D86ECC|nr:NRAMP (natural resistance-associated macrophage protein)-like metal ion transporter [Rhodanobacter sp. ANJX3]NYE27155.1 NRAMP (natural resistance-associated macrophage protein)-like metal ion transporter [Rhodanobacter sp. K2T2]